MQKKISFPSGLAGSACSCWHVFYFGALETLTDDEGLCLNLISLTKKKSYLGLSFANLKLAAYYG